MRPLASFVVVALAASALLPGTALAAGTGRVQGQVSDDDGKPIPQFEVRFVPTDGSTNKARVVKTGKDGEFNVAFFPAGRYKIEAVDPGKFLRKMTLVGYDPNGSEIMRESQDAHPEKGFGEFPVVAAGKIRIELVATGKQVQRELQNALAFNEAVGPLKRAQAKYQDNDFAGALEETDAVIAKKPDIPQAHFLRGVALARLERFDEAIAALEKSRELDPNQGTLHDSLGTIQMQKAEALAKAGNKAEAAQVYSRAADNFAVELQKAPGDANLMMKRAASLDAAGREKDLEEQLRQVVAAMPDNKDAWVRLTVLTMKAGRTEEALDLIDKHLGTEPSVAPIVYNVAVQVYNSGKLDEAIGLAQKAMKIDPKLHLGHRLMYRVYLQQDKRGLALESLRALVAAAPPTDPEIESEKEIIKQLEKSQKKK